MVERAQRVFESDARYALRILPHKERRIAELEAEVARLQTAAASYTPSVQDHPTSAPHPLIKLVTKSLAGMVEAIEADMQEDARDAEETGEHIGEENYEIALSYEAAKVILSALEIER